MTEAKIGDRVKLEIEGKLLGLTRGNFSNPRGLMKESAVLQLDDDSIVNISSQLAIDFEAVRPKAKDLPLGTIIKAKNYYARVKTNPDQWSAICDFDHSAYLIDALVDSHDFDIIFQPDENMFHD